MQKAYRWLVLCLVVATSFSIVFGRDCRVQIVTDPAKSTIEIAMGGKWTPMPSNADIITSRQFFRISSSGYVPKIVTALVPEKDNWSISSLHLRKIDPRDTRTGVNFIGSPPDDLKLWFTPENRGSGEEQSNLISSSGFRECAPGAITIRFRNLARKGAETRTLPPSRLQKAGDQIDFEFAASDVLAARPAGSSTDGQPANTSSLANRDSGAADIETSKGISDVPAVPVENVGDQWKKIMENGQKAFSAGKYSKACAMFQEARQISDTDVGKAAASFFAASCREYMSPYGIYTADVSQLYSDAERLDPQARIVWVAHETYLLRCGKENDAKVLRDSVPSETVDRSEYTFPK